MDNIVDYLVVGFFIISFLSSIFKKKKKTVSNSESEPQTVKTQNRKAIKKKRASNPFEDFVKSINVELANAKAEATRSEVDEYYEQAMQNSDDTEVVVQETYQQPRPTSLIQETVREVEKGTISIKSYADSVELSKAKRESNISKNIKKSLLKTDSIRDFIIMNEVLGKPKALQR